MTPLGAVHYQTADDVIRGLAEQNEGNIRRGMTTAFNTLRAAVPMDRLEKLLANGDLGGILKEVPFDGLVDDMSDAFVQIGALFDKAANARLKGLDVNQSLIRPFDRLDPAVVNVLTTFRADMVREVTTATRDALNHILFSGTLGWKAPAEMATDIRSIIGLTDRQAQAVLNYRSMLESGDADALTRELRDRRFDSSVSAAISGDRSLSDDQIDRQVERYADRYLNYRATTIARTESLRAANRGARAGVEQAVERNIIGRQEIRRFWLIATDERTCDFCRSIPTLNPGGVGLDEAYDSIDGPVDGPDDSHPNCRCTETFKVDDGSGDTGDGGGDE